MLGYILRRLAALPIILLLTSLVVFAVMRIVPSDPARALVGIEADQESYEAVREELGLDDPLYVQYFNWLGQTLRGDFGQSYKYNEPVSSLIVDRFPLTLQLTVMALLLALTLGIPMGVVASTARNSGLDRVVTLIAVMGIAAPSFWLGVLLIKAFSVELGWFPSFGYVPFSESPIESIHSLTLPAIALGLPTAAVVMRMVRSAMVDVLAQDYVRTAHAKGLSKFHVLVRHALRNSLVPLLTVIGLAAGQLLGGSIIIEVVFALPGLGRLVIDSILTRELQVVQGIVWFMALLILLVNLTVDIGYGLADPRIRSEL